MSNARRDTCINCGASLGSKQRQNGVLCCGYACRNQYRADQRRRNEERLTERNTAALVAYMRSRGRGSGLEAA